MMMCNIVYRKVKMNYIGWIMLMVVLSIDDTNAVPLSGFISYGLRNGDQSFSGLHRAASFAISISPSIPYFNESLQYHICKLSYSIYVSLVSKCVSYSVQIVL